MMSVVCALEVTLGVTFTVDAHTLIGNNVCEKYFTRKHTFTRDAHTDNTIGETPVIWCYTPDVDPMPLLRSVVRYVTTRPGAKAYILCAKVVGTPAHAFLEKYPICHSYPAGASLFAVPAQRGLNRIFLPTPPTDAQFDVYKIEHDPIAAITASLSKMSMSQTKYIFKVRLGRVSVRASTNYTSHVLTEDEVNQLHDNFMVMRQKLALGDTGASHPLITSITARQIGAYIDITETGRVILGDNISPVKLLGSCSFEIKIGTYVSIMKAYVIDADWGAAQHIVIGADWIRENQAMLGERDGKGPQLTVGNQTVYAKVKEHSPYLSNSGNNSIKQLNSMEFYSLIDKSGNGRKWTAVDITDDGVMHAGRERIPLSEYLNTDELAEFHYRQYEVSYGNMEVTVTPPKLHHEPKIKEPPKPTEFDPLIYTSGGVELAFLEEQKIKFPTVFRDDLPDRTDG